MYFLLYQAGVDDTATASKGFARSEPMTGGEFRITTNKTVDVRLVVGSALFGVSMGISGFCPAPAALLAFGGDFGAILIWLPLYVCGVWVHKVFL